MDLYRVVAVVIVVAGHWLAASVTFRGGRFGDQNVLAGMPWTQWLTLLFQVIPVFFLVAGYANAASWSGWDGGWQGWLRHRLTAVLAPTTVYVGVMLATVAALQWSAVDPSQLAFGAWAVAMHLWFLPVYLLLVSATPLAVAAHRRWGWVVPVGLVLTVGAVDIAVLAGGLPATGALNYLLGWAAVYQVGIAWFAGALRGWRPALLAAVSGVGLVFLIWLGRYPLSMVGVPGQAVRNTSPPNIALLAFSAAQAGLLVVAAPAVNARLRRLSRPHALATANSTAMALYLWHMVPVVLVAIAVYPIGLLPQSALGSAAWWMTRFPWLGALALVTAVLLLLSVRVRARLARCAATLTRRVSIRPSGPMLLAGAGMSALGLVRFAVDGFAPDGRFPAVTAVLFAVGVVLGTCARAQSSKQAAQ
ncbi:acyltransferase [Amycolatopsis sp. NPDC051903]|uniref:acyltransferase n=1 Tax=Amycolatopsis sp. NPDC051903 TaxID=3363936 RepID=UPI00378E4CD7